MTKKKGRETMCSKSNRGRLLL